MAAREMESVGEAVMRRTTRAPKLAEQEVGGSLGFGWLR